MRIIDADATRAALAFPALIAALREAFAQGATIPPRHHHEIVQPDGAHGTLLLMPAWQAGGYLGVKIATIYPDNGARSLPGVYATYLLCEGSTGRPIALIDGNQITARRTIAASALAADYLAHTDASRLLVVGAGRVGSLAAEAFAAVRPIRHVAVWNPSAARADALVADLNKQGFGAERVDDMEAATRAADIVCCATLSTTPLIRAEWLAPGTHLDLIGGFTPDMREADNACFANARVFVDTLDAIEEAGDLVGPIAAGVLDRSTIGTLAALCNGSIAGRRDAGERTIFKAVGTALSDIAAAALVVRTVE